MAGLNRSRGLDFLLSGNKIKEQAETEVKAATTVQESNTTILHALNLLSPQIISYISS